MTSTQKAMLVALSVVLLSAVIGYAETVKDLNQNMWTWAVMEEILEECAHGSLGSLPPIGPQEAEETMMTAQQAIAKLIAGITTTDELQAARRLAAEFVQMGEPHDRVGRAVNRLLDRQEAFLHAHGEIAK
ncbi:MAG: hypothetical protein GX442_01205 [Candidatus Riflebacteria bacterium]|nr:hypothetical protein [Candidatus Riflebacteria bacterium]